MTGLNIYLLAAVVVLLVLLVAIVLTARSAARRNASQIGRLKAAVRSVEQERNMAEKEARRLEEVVNRRTELWQTEIRRCVKARLDWAERGKVIKHLEAKLAVFTGPRERDKKGHFLSAKKVAL